MRKLAIRLVAALSTFVIGIFVVAIWSANYPKVTRVVPPPVLRAVDKDVRSLPDEQWRKVTVEGRFSFYIPQYLHNVDQPISSRHAERGFRRANDEMRGLFYLGYDSDKAISCYDDAPSRYKATTRSEILINGQRARIITEIPDIDEVMCRHDVPMMHVCFPDIGHGQKLSMRFSSADTESLEVAKQIINTIEFQ
jgi:hypothetical protein